MTSKMWVVLVALAALAMFSVPTWSSSEEQTAPAPKQGPRATMGECCPKAATECPKECCTKCTKECARECGKQCLGEMRECGAKGGKGKRCCKQS